jgi:hypothetical protein
MGLSVSEIQSLAAAQGITATSPSGTGTPLQTLALAAGVSVNQVITDLGGNPNAPAAAFWAAIAPKVSASDLATAQAAGGLKLSGLSQSSYNATLEALQNVKTAALALGYTSPGTSYAIDPANFTTSWNQANQSIFGQVGSSIGSAIGSAAQGISQALGGQGNPVGQAFAAAGTFAKQAGYTIGNDPAQAATDAITGVPGAFVAAAVGGAAIVSDATGAILTGVGQATGNQGLAQTGQQISDVTGDILNTGFNNPVAAGQVLLGGVQAILSGGSSVGTLAAGLSAYGADLGSQLSATPGATNPSGGTLPPINPTGLIPQPAPKGPSGFKKAAPWIAGGVLVAILAGIAAWELA